MGLFDFCSAAQRKRDDEKYANRIFPRGIQVQDEIFALLEELLPKSSKRWLMMTFVCGKEGVLRLRSKSELYPSYDQEREAALKHINPKRSKLTEKETAVVLALVFADLASDAGAPMATAQELRAQLSGIAPSYSK